MTYVKKCSTSKKKALVIYLILIMSSVKINTEGGYPEIQEENLYSIIIPEEIRSSNDDNPFVFMSHILGGNMTDVGREVVVDHEENIIVTGYTSSADFPVTTNAYDTSFNGGAFFETDLFLMKFSSNGSLIFSTFFGGTADEWVRGVDVDSLGNIVIVGYTRSIDFPTFNNESTHTIDSNWDDDIFISKFSPNGSLLWM
jgi:hypothetical protein